MSFEWRSLPFPSIGFSIDDFDGEQPPDEPLVTVADDAILIFVGRVHALLYKGRFLFGVGGLFAADSVHFVRHEFVVLFIHGFVEVDPEFDVVNTPGIVTDGGVVSAFPNVGDDVEGLAFVGADDSHVGVVLAAFDGFHALNQNHLRLRVGEGGKKLWRAGRRA